jgi:Tol biopolymer transport system component
MLTGAGKTTRRSLAGCGLALALLAVLAPGAGAGVSIGPSSATPTVAYVTQTSSSQPIVWTIHSDGTQNTRIGPGFTPLISPSAQQIAASLFGASPSSSETGPALAIYSTSGAATQTYFNLAGETVQPLAWSRDGRYVAVDIQSTKLKNAAKLSGLGIVDITTGATKVIAHGQIFGASFSPNGNDEVVYGRSATQTLTARVNVYRSNADGSGTVALTRDGRRAQPVPFVGTEGDRI